MSNEQINNYIASERARGVRDEDIRAELIKTGWSEADVASAITPPDVNSSLTPTEAPLAELPGAIELLKESWALFAVNFMTYVGIVLLPMLLWGGLAAVVVGGLFGLSLFSVLFSNMGVIGYLAVALGVIVAVFAILVLQFWGRVALLSAVRDSTSGPVTIIDAFKRSWSMVGAYVWVAFLVSFVVMGGFLLFIIPGIIFMVWFSLATYVVVNENIRGMDALMRAKEYARGKWFPIFLRLVFIGIVILAATYIPAYFITATGIPYLGEILQLLLGVVVGPLGVVYGYLLYRALRRMRGADIPAPTNKWVFITIGFVGGLLVPILLMSSIVFASLSTAREKSRDAKRISDIGQIQLALELYYDTHQSYPATLQPLVDERDIPVYGKELVNNSDYVYAQINGGKSYAVGASLERGDNYVLMTDDDARISEFSTGDGMGCHGEYDRHCYDIYGEDYFSQSDSSLPLDASIPLTAPIDPGVATRDATRLDDILSIQLALGTYKQANLQYPQTLEVLVPTYLKQNPSDPTDMTHYFYQSETKGAGYTLGASLENKDDIHLLVDADQVTSNFHGGDDKGCKGEVNRYCYDVKP